MGGRSKTGLRTWEMVLPVLVSRFWFSRCFCDILTHVLLLKNSLPDYEEFICIRHAGIFSIHPNLGYLSIFTSSLLVIRYWLKSILIKIPTIFHGWPHAFFALSFGVSPHQTLTNPSSTPFGGRTGQNRRRQGENGAHPKPYLVKEPGFLGKGNKENFSDQPEQPVWKGEWTGRHYQHPPTGDWPAPDSQTGRGHHLHRHLALLFLPAPNEETGHHMPLFKSLFQRPFWRPVESGAGAGQERSSFYWSWSYKNTTQAGKRPRFIGSDWTCRDKHNNMWNANMEIPILLAKLP